MKPLLFSLPGSEDLAKRVGGFMQHEAGHLMVRRFPDRESYLRFLTPVRGRDVILAARLHDPDEKTLCTYFAARIARELGASSVGLLIPYLPYMRQDARFNDGEGTTSLHFASLVSGCSDWMVTVDPHLHRHVSLSEIYSIKTRVVSSSGPIARWIAENVERPLLIGPDEESRQWVAQLGALANCPYLVMQKRRDGDFKVEIAAMDLQTAQGRNPVILDDIVSTARTMVAAVARVKEAGLPAPVCIAVHALFCNDAYAALQVAGVSRIVSCNSIPHATNHIELEESLAAAATDLLATDFKT